MSKRNVKSRKAFCNHDHLYINIFYSLPCSADNNLDYPPFGYVILIRLLSKHKLLGDLSGINLREEEGRKTNSLGF